MEAQLDRETFLNLAIAELKRQGVYGSVKPGGDRSFLSSSSWTAGRTYRELLLPQPRAPPQGLDNLAAWIIKHVEGVVEGEEEEGIEVSAQLVAGIVNLISHGEPGIGNLAAAVFISTLAAKNSNLLILPRLILARSLPSYTQFPAPSLPHLASVITSLEHEDDDAWEIYLHVLAAQQCVSVPVFMSVRPGSRAQEETTTAKEAIFIEALGQVICRVEKEKMTSTIDPAVGSLLPCLANLIRTHPLPCVNLLRLTWDHLVLPGEKEDSLGDVLHFCASEWQSSTSPHDALLLHVSTSPRHHQDFALLIRQVLAPKVWPQEDQIVWPLCFALLEPLSSEEDGELRRRLLQAEARGAMTVITWLASRPELVAQLARGVYAEALAQMLMREGARSKGGGMRDKNMKRMMSVLRGGKGIE